MFFKLTALLPLLALAASASPVVKRYEGVQISAGRDGKCLGVSEKTASGADVQSVDCKNAYGMRTLWNISPGAGQVLIHGPGNNQFFALDAGQNSNGGKLSVTDPSGAATQNWYLTDDQRIAVTGGDQCLDEGDDGVQTWQCTTGNTNQVWNIVSSS